MATPTATRFPFTTRFRPQRLPTSSLLIHRRATASALVRATGGLSLHPPPLRRPGRPRRPPGRITDKRFGHHLRQPAPGVLPVGFLGAETLGGNQHNPLGGHPASRDPPQLVARQWRQVDPSRIAPHLHRRRYLVYLLSARAGCGEEKH